MLDKPYRGIAMLGNSQLSSIYTLDEGISDINGVGIYHLYYRDYSEDLVQSATSMVRAGEHLYVGNKHYQPDTHHENMRPKHSENINGYQFCDTFSLDAIDIEKTDRAYGFGDNAIIFECEVLNKGSQAREIELLGYTHFRNITNNTAKVISSDLTRVTKGQKVLGMVTADSPLHYLCADSPTDFAHTIFGKVFSQEEQHEDVETPRRLALAKGKRVTLEPGESYCFRFALIAAETEQNLEDIGSSLATNFNNAPVHAEAYWQGFFDKSNLNQFDLTTQDYVKANLVAIKSANLNGFIPADLTGHYYDKSTNLPCYYARDSLMVARAFLHSGHVTEAREIIAYLNDRERNEHNEFFQRYNGLGEPNEGANNDVFHQIDSIGYFFRMVDEFYQQTGEMLTDKSTLTSLIEVLENAKSRNGMLGEEGGVNEGVYGPAYITSSNMFIYGGLKSAQTLMETMGEQAWSARCEKLQKQILSGIESTFNESLGRYDYGYVAYQPETVKRYDTPQYFGVLYGFDNTEAMEKTHAYLSKKASFHGNGIGYSEQEYHHGPWLFNTAACAQYCALTGKHSEYHDKYKWLMGHSNAYGLMPEAVDATDESICFINPLTWACAEFIAASFVEIK
ncbi:hypothetical protein PTW35_20840 (plasmid) [Photobacterium sp. DA100]|uniref:hypothetical protein n=1 Tax=Photobacterium sp. DA100 TaxID=3027472 RepID=UPI0024792B8A|nr:hypothetical protein [Photobacterium sp. DA100]WEM45528.1 hypothetical protein PTW35_20840 [Photobacterium sp. DA100]